MLDRIDIQAVIAIAKEAGEEILDVYKCDFEVESKDDKSPLTEADKRSNNIIIGKLQELYPDIPFISEETKQRPFEERKGWEYFWLIDPLDGTKEFIKKNGEFTVNIALIHQHKPVLGVVHVPVMGDTYFAIEGKGAFKMDSTDQSKQLEASPNYMELDSIKVVASRSHLSEEVEQFVEDLRGKGKQVEFISAGSSLKFCLVAEGKADVYPRFGPTMEWDTGAAHIVVTEAGKKVTHVDRKTPLVYNKENLLNPFFIVQ